MCSSDASSPVRPVDPGQPGNCRRHSIRYSQDVSEPTTATRAGLPLHYTMCFASVFHSRITSRLQSATSTCACTSPHICNRLLRTCSSAHDAQRSCHILLQRRHTNVHTRHKMRRFLNRCAPSHRAPRSSHLRNHDHVACIHSYASFRRHTRRCRLRTRRDTPRTPLCTIDARAACRSATD